MVECAALVPTAGFVRKFWIDLTLHCFFASFVNVRTSRTMSTDGGGDAAASPSRTAQNLTDSQNLDARISRETDSLREKIDVKNQEIATKTKVLNKLVDENKDLQKKLDIITDPSTTYSLIIDLSLIHI